VENEKGWKVFKKNLNRKNKEGELRQETNPLGRTMNDKEGNFRVKSIFLFITFFLSPILYSRK
jgi:hypothetical protein